MNEYFTIQSSTESLYKEKGSKFLGFTYHVESEEEVKGYLDHLKKQYHDARHHCYAYITGLKEQSYRANDDGEPNHSAGDPILGQIRSRELTNCLVVVVRYFGGTKLGVSGLINAYKTAAEEALSKAKILKVHSKTPFRLTFDYDATSDVERALSEFEIDYHEKKYTVNCEFVGELKDEDAPVLAGKLELVKGANFEISD